MAQNKILPTVKGVFEKISMSHLGPLVCVPYQNIVILLFEAHLKSSYTLGG